LQGEDPDFAKYITKIAKEKGRVGTPTLIEV